MLWLQSLGKKPSFARCLGQTNLLMLKILLERQEVTAAYPGDIDTSGSHLGELLLPSTLWTLVMQVLFWNTSSNLFSRP